MLKNAIRGVYFVLFLLTPLFFYPKTSELFEFNKIIVLYVSSIVITSLWLVLSILNGKFIFKRTIIDVPFALFLGSQILSTIFSIDGRTSLLGYYSRFNGGLASIVCYALLYWIFVSVMSRRDVIHAIKVLLVSTTIASIWGTLEHFGASPSCYVITGTFGVDCWVQDVQLRVFATFGQPNWMAAWLVAVIPLTWVAFFLRNTFYSKYFLLTTLFSTLFTAALLFTKSRSGVLGLAAAGVVFGGLLLVLFIKDRSKVNLQKHLHALSIPVAIFVAILIIGSPWTPSFFEMTNKGTVTQQELVAKVSGPALESGGTESGDIRKIVWQGAFNVWKQFPLLGSGVETFALSYYNGRPLAHNQTSEWNFLYNKAHNEYLNYLATTGILGLTTYLVLIGSIVLVLFPHELLHNKEKKDLPLLLIKAGSLSAFISLLVTNFFGFSVVPTSLLFYLLPAFVIAFKATEKESHFVTAKISMEQKIGTSLVLFAMIVILTQCGGYWTADYLFARASAERENNNYAEAVSLMNTVIHLQPVEALFRAELGSMYADLAKASVDDQESSQLFTTKALVELNAATALSPKNVRIIKSVGNSYSDLGDTDPQYLIKMIELTFLLQNLAPTDPSVHYQRSLGYAKIGELQNAIHEGEIAIQMKPDYKIARRLLGFLYKENKETVKAIQEMEYILKNISPDDVSIQKELESLRKI